MITKLKCLKSWEDCDPEAAREYQEKFAAKLADEIDVDEQTLEVACDRIWYDGNYGPLDDEEYNEANETNITLKQALKIVKEARDVKFDDIEFQNPELEPVCSCYDDVVATRWEEEPAIDCDHNNYVIGGEDIYKEYWKWYRDIYG